MKQARKPEAVIQNGKTSSRRVFLLRKGSDETAEPGP